VSKLVRDRIPDRINAEEEGVVALVRRANEDEMYGLLVSKLFEEIQEFLDAVSIDSKAEELADVNEVLRALAFCVDSSPAEVEWYRKHKFDDRGGFNHGIVLMGTVGP
jgi:predicted house-cleaning noncanonical NTP pyrophosphatase (MazG superfamily)